MQFVDTNILIYAADRDSEHHLSCRNFLDAQRVQAAPTYIGWNIVYEFMRVCTHPRVFNTPMKISQASAFIDAVLAGPAISVLLPTERHRAVLDQTLNELPDVRGNLVHDLHTAVLMREHGISQIVTRDTDFHRFPYLRVVDPIRL